VKFRMPPTGRRSSFFRNSAIDILIEFSSVALVHLLGKQTVRSFHLMGIGLCLCGLLTVRIQAETFQLTDGQSVTGDIVNADGNGLQLRLPGENKYQLVRWTKLSQADLKRLAEKPKFAQYVEPFIEIPQAERIKKTEVVIKPVTRLDLPAKGSFFGALFGSSVGLVSILLIYVANLYAAYEISVVRAYSPGLVCGISAVAPFVGPIVFLFMPTKIASAQEWKPGQAHAPAVEEPGAAAGAAAASESGQAYPPTEAAAAATAPALPQTQVFQRGKFTFNRRFFETKFASFFGLVRRAPDKDMVLLFKTARSEYVAHRISRIAATDLHIEVRKGTATQEVSIAFVEIQEVQLKHKDV
jgi:hypothetical protein